MKKKLPQFVVCIKKDDCYPEDLEPRKLYQVVPDKDLENEWGLQYIRVIDDSGEDYMYPRSCFVEIEVSDKVKKTLVNLIKVLRKQ